MAIYESEFYKMEVGEGEDYKSPHYLIINKVTGVVETETRLFPQGAAYCDQLSDSYAESIAPEEVKSDDNKRVTNVIPTDFKSKQH